MVQISQKQLMSYFKVIRVLGKGSFGKVFLVRDVRTNEQYAMKKYSTEHLLQNGKYASLIRSVKILNNLNHENIIKFIAHVKAADDAYFLLFEPCKKGSLENLKPVLRAIKDKHIIKYIIFQLAQALAYLKFKQVAHRDIKPSNLAFTSQGVLKVIDFDQAIIFNNSVNNSMQFDEKEEKQFGVQKGHLHSRRSIQNSYVGTDDYMSPEMKFNTQADQKGDVWAFGIILFQLFVGQSFYLPIQKKDEELTEQVLENLIIQSNNKLDSECMNLLQKLLIRDPKKRIIGQQIVNQQYFKELRENEEYVNKCKKRFVRMLRANSSIMDPYTVVEALEADLIGMQSGLQRFQLLHTVIFLKKYQILNLYYLYGGVKYFKLLNADDQKDKRYIYYDSIDTISIKEDQIVIEVRPQVWNKDVKAQTIRLKHLHENMLSPLYNLMIYIFND